MRPGNKAHQIQGPYPGKRAERRADVEGVGVRPGLCNLEKRLAAAIPAKELRAGDCDDGSLRVHDLHRSYGRRGIDEQGHLAGGLRQATR